MKILQVNCVYKKGSTGKLTADIHVELLNQGIESVVCYGRGDTIDEPNVYKTCNEYYSFANHFSSYLTGVMYGGCYFSTKKLETIIKKENPDVVHLQCINGYFVNIYKFIEWLRDNKIKTVLTLHAEFMYTANCGHALDCNKWKTGCGDCPRLRKETGSYFIDGTSKSWQKMKKAFDGFNDNLIVTSVSPWLMDRAKLSPILADKNHMVVLNGLDTEVFHPYNTENLHVKNGLSNEKIVFHASPNFNNEKNHIKGGYYVLQLAQKMPDIKFLVAGSHPENMEVPSNVVLLGAIKDQNLLAQYYSMADVTLLTSKKETFSMVTAESLCCGTPVIGFKAGGPESIALPNYSEFVEYGDLDALYDAVIRAFSIDLKGLAVLAEQKYSKEKMTQDYIKVYKRLTGENIC